MGVFGLYAAWHRKEMSDILEYVSYFDAIAILSPSYRHLIAILSQSYHNLIDFDKKKIIAILSLSYRYLIAILSPKKSPKTL